MNKEIPIPIALAIIIVLSVLVIGLFTHQYYLIFESSKHTKIESPEPIACTQEAKLCPDGSYVGRTGSDCNFAPCPTPLNNIACQENSKYFVISKEYMDSSSGKTAADFLIKYKINKDQVISCDYVADNTDFEFKNQDYARLITLNGDYLILGIGNAPIYELVIYNLTNRKKVYAETITGDVKIGTDNILTYSGFTNEKITSKNCPDINEYLPSEASINDADEYADIVGNFSLSLSTLIRKDLGEHNCEPKE